MPAGRVPQLSSPSTAPSQDPGAGPSPSHATPAFRGGDLDLLYAGVAAETGAGSAPIDVVTTSHGRFLHVLASGTDALLSFAIARDGSLSFVSEIATPDGANGLVTR
jgi:hypothetical protein